MNSKQTFIWYFYFGINDLYMKLKILLSTFLFIGILKSSGQTVLDTDGLNNLNNVYLFSLKVYCSTLDSSKTKTIYIKDEYFIGESWPKEISGF